MGKYCVGEDELGPGHLIVGGPYTSPNQCLDGCDGSSTSSNSLLVNGNFNSPTPTSCAGLQRDPNQGSLPAPPWYIGLNCDAFTYCDPLVPGYQPNRFVGFNWTANLCAIQQAITTKPFTSYWASFDMANQPGFNSVGTPGPTESRFLEVVIYGLTPTEMNNLQNWSSPGEPTNTTYQVIYQTHFAIPKLNVPDNYEGLGWQNKLFSFSSTTAATLIRFRVMDTRLGSPATQDSRVVLDNVSVWEG